RQDFRSIVPITAAAPARPIFNLAHDRNKDRAREDQRLDKCTREPLSLLGDTGHARKVEREHEIVRETFTNDIERPLANLHAFGVGPIGLFEFSKPSLALSQTVSLLAASPFEKLEHLNFGVDHPPDREPAR